MTVTEVSPVINIAVGVLAILFLFLRSWALWLSRKGETQQAGKALRAAGGVLLLLIIIYLSDRGLSSDIISVIGLVIAGILAVGYLCAPIKMMEKR